MAKDPAFLFYPNDYIGGTMGMTFEEKGAYIELLMLQFNRGHMTTHMIAQTVGQIWDTIQDKFKIDENGLYYNVRLEQEQYKRKAYSESRRNNVKGKNQYTENKENPKKESGHMTSHMKGHMEDEDEDVNIDDNIEDKVIKEKTWKNDYQIYIRGLNYAINILLADKQWMDERKKFHPSIDIKLSLEKAYTDFWGTEAGWKHKKKQRTSDIDWKKTMNSAIEMNKVYKVK